MIRLMFIFSLLGATLLFFYRQLCAAFEYIYGMQFVSIYELKATHTVQRARCSRLQVMVVIEVLFHLRLSSTSLGFLRVEPISGKPQKMSRHLESSRKPHLFLLFERALKGSIYLPSHGQLICICNFGAAEMKPNSAGYLAKFAVMGTSSIAHHDSKTTRKNHLPGTRRPWKYATACGPRQSLKPTALPLEDLFKHVYNDSRFGCGEPRPGSCRDVKKAVAPL